MNPEMWHTVDDYISSTLIGPDTALDATLAASDHAGLRAINVAPNQGKFLHLLARIHGARRILEIGTLGGYSAIWLARALPADGALISLEADADTAKIARDNIASAGLADKVTVITGLAADSLHELIRNGTAPFDLIFIDADKSGNPDYLRLTLQLARAGTVMVADNVVRSGRVADRSSNEPDAVGIRRYFDMLAAAPGIDSTAVQTVGIKGWDGFAISIVSDPAAASAALR
ncbi:O-methyltransferase [Paraburkholderia phosphatilytica]|uniref:O-methyltransferase n=1 Tax=Paraburkholderia phosphatilytica TaxID=2282883 RepID=UPI000E53E4EA|nr:O-methyltransferase [Paraburkholderia phosphatilytica]